MKNVAKFELTREAVENFKKRTDYLFEDAQQKEKKKGVKSKVYQKAFFKSLAITQLTIDRKKGVVRFEEINIGNYIQPIYNKKRRVNVIPICFLVQLYKESIADIPEAKISEIPFTLKGFWKMDKAMDCLADLTKVKIKQASQVRRIIYRIVEGETDEKKKTEYMRHLEKILPAIEAVKVSNPENGIIMLKYRKDTFKLDVGNTKVNVVPLCIILCHYYINVIRSVEKFLQTVENVSERNKMEDILESLRDFMEKYFIPRML